MKKKEELFAHPWRLVIPMNSHNKTEIQVVMKDQPLASINLGTVDPDLARHLVEAHNLWLVAEEIRKI